MAVVYPVGQGGKLGQALLFRPDGRIYACLFYRL